MTPEETTTVLHPGDLDRMRWAVYEAADISTRGVVKQSGLPWERAQAALNELLARGEITNAVGHHHGDSDLCQYSCGGGLALTHWYSRRSRG